MKDGIVWALVFGAFFFLLEEKREKTNCHCKDEAQAKGFQKAVGARLILEIPEPEK